MAGALPWGRWDYRRRTGLLPGTTMQKRRLPLAISLVGHSLWLPLGVVWFVEVALPNIGRDPSPELLYNQSHHGPSPPQGEEESETGRSVVATMACSGIRACSTREKRPRRSLEFSLKSLQTTLSCSSHPTSLIIGNYLNQKIRRGPHACNVRY